MARTKTRRHKEGARLLCVFVSSCEPKRGFRLRGIDARAPIMTLILGLESSCDETAAALVTDGREILAHRLAGQEAEHTPYGGVVPEIAARAHVEALTPLVEAALADAGKS